VPARTPTILATSGGFRQGRRTALTPGPLIRHAIELGAGSGRPRLCFVGTAQGDARILNAHVHEAFYGTGVEVTCLNLLPMPTFEDPRGHLLGQDVVWVHGGSVAGLLALWRVHGLDVAFREAWEAGVVLAGVSAGSICWHVGSNTDSYGPDLQPVTDGLGLLPYANGVHFDADPQRRPALHRLVGEGRLPTAYATDVGVGLLYRGTELTEAVAEVDGGAAYRVERAAPGRVTETRLEPRRLPEG
jgi:peptidase E